MIREVCNTREEWLAARCKDYGTGASDASVILGINPWQTIDELYNERTGLVAPKDISEAPQVKFGTMAEEHLRALAELDLGDQYNFEYHQFDILRHERYPFIFATLDGELTRKSDGKKGILEIKTGSFKRAADLAAWEKGVPKHYLAQNVQQLLATGYDFVIDYGRIKRNAMFDNDAGLPTVKEYYRFLDREQLEDSIHYLTAELIKFHNCCTNRVRPATLFAI